MHLIEKTLRYKGAETTVFFRELTGGEQIELLKGQTAQHTAGAGTTLQIDMSAELARNDKLAFFMLVDAEGKQVYRNLDAFLKEPGSKVRKIRELAVEANAEFNADDEADEKKA